MENTTDNNNNKVFIWIAVGCLGIIACAVAVVIFGFGGLVWLGSKTPDDVTTSVDVPVNAEVGDDFKFTVRITNTGSDSITLTSVDISLNYLAGFVVSETDPPYIATSQYDALGGGETFQAYKFEMPIPAGETIIITFFSQAVHPGDFSGTFYMCVENDFNCATNVGRTIIK